MVAYYVIGHQVVCSKISSVLGYLPGLSVVLLSPLDLVQKITEIVFERDVVLAGLELPVEVFDIFGVLLEYQ